MAMFCFSFESVENVTIKYWSDRSKIHRKRSRDGWVHHTTKSS